MFYRNAPWADVKATQINKKHLPQELGKHPKYEVLGNLLNKRYNNGGRLIFNKPAGSSHHSQTERMIILSYFYDITPKIAAIYFNDEKLMPEDWGSISLNRGLKTTPSCVLNKSGLKKMKLIWNNDSLHPTINRYLGRIENTNE